MAVNSKVYEYPVPEGFPDMSLPTKPETRIPDDKIDIVYAEASDLEEWAALAYDAFRDAFWAPIETEDRPPLEERIRRVAKHWSIWIKQPGIHAIKAVHKDTGELESSLYQKMGIAGWHECGVHDAYPTTYAAFPDLVFPSTFVPCAWRDDTYEELSLDKQAGWSEADKRELREFHNETFATTWLGFDRARLQQMGTQGHWYLAPLCVWEKFRGRGVGKELLMWGIRRADEQGVPAILEALPNARPVYYHLGFQPTTANGPGKEFQLLRPVSKAAET